MDRKTYVAGRFYPDDPTELRDMINGYLGEPGEQVSIPGVVLPHAGYI
ncbi:MAG: AmmeMemoRadiSam system protein B [Caldisericia bacterium]|nr:AmmeMemoRadiSam system protein B [Caldisericia bacterium]